jgi:hypothetical protein
MKIATDVRIQGLKPDKILRVLFLLAEPYLLAA